MAPSGGVLLVTAHPDDEAMFFVPTLAHFVACGEDVGVLCLSNGAPAASAAAAP
jgi:N-acetylglucosaminylphosphatidylinositol deacetylase